MVLSAAQLVASNEALVITDATGAGAITDNDADVTFAIASSLCGGRQRRATQSATISEENTSDDPDVHDQQGRHGADRLEQAW